MHLAPGIMTRLRCTPSPVQSPWHFLLWQLHSWEYSSSGKDGRKMHNGRYLQVVNTVSLLLLFFPWYLGGKKLEMTKYWPAVFSKPSSRTSNDIALLYPLRPPCSHTQFYECAFMHKNLHVWRDWLAMSSWARLFHFYCWKKSPVYN